MFKKEEKKIDVKPDRINEIKDRVLKNNQVAIDILGKNIKEGNRACPFLGGSPCIGEFCMHFMKFTSIDRDTGKKIDFYNCAHTQQNNLIIELNQNIRQLIELQNKKGDGNV